MFNTPGMLDNALQSRRTDKAGKDARDRENLTGVSMSSDGPDAKLDTKLMDEAGRRRAIIDFVGDYSAEVTPGQADKVADFGALLPKGIAINVTFLPGSDFEDTLRVCRRLTNEGYVPVPHLAARSIPDEATLDTWLARLVAEANVEEVLCIAGGVTNPVGEFSSTMEWLDTGLLDKHGIRRVGIAGHPEGSPDIPYDALVSALAWKNAFSERTGADLTIVTQFCFEAAPIINWDRAMREAGNRLPIRIGVPGPATFTTLLKYAQMAGIGPSMRFLTRQTRNVAKLMTVAAPDKLVHDLANYWATDPDCGIQNCHFYPLGGLKKTAGWINGVRDGAFTLRRDGKGFNVTRNIEQIGPVIDPVRR